MTTVESESRFEQTSPESDSSTESIENVTRVAFQKVQNLWSKYSRFIPQDYDFRTGENHQVNFPGGNMSLSERKVWPLPYPRIRDVSMPEDLLPFFTKLIEKNKRGKNKFIPGFGSVEACFHLYGHFPVTKEEDTLGLMAVQNTYDDWVQSWYEDWISRGPKVIGWEADVHDSQSGRYEFYFSKDGQLIGFYSSQKQPAEKDYDRKKRYMGHNELPMLLTQASFRGNKLWSIFYEVPNGTLFPDPRGEIGSIWPQWIKKGMDSIDGTDDRVEYLGKDGYPATEKDWKWYLARCKEKKLVLSPRTGNYVHQTERQAVANLKRSRVWIYYHTTQGFHFYKTGREPDFVSEVGYSVRSKFGGRFIPKKPGNENSNHVASKSQTIELLSSWNPDLEIDMK